MNFPTTLGYAMKARVKDSIVLYCPFSTYFCKPAFYLFPHRSANVGCFIFCMCCCDTSARKQRKTLDNSRALCAPVLRQKLPSILHISRAFVVVSDVFPLDQACEHMVQACPEAFELVQQAWRLKRRRIINFHWMTSMTACIFPVATVLSLI